MARGNPFNVPCGQFDECGVPLYTQVTSESLRRPAPNWPRGSAALLSQLRPRKPPPTMVLPCFFPFFGGPPRVVSKPLPPPPALLLSWPWYFFPPEDPLRHWILSGEPKLNGPHRYPGSLRSSPYILLIFSLPPRWSPYQLISLLEIFDFVLRPCAYIPRAFLLVRPKGL